MSLIKIIGALTVIVSAAVIARELTLRVDSSVRYVSALRSLLEHTKNMVDCYSLPASEILRRTDKDIFADCGYKNSTLPRDFCELLQGISAEDGEAFDIFSSFARDFGKSYRADEASRCALYLEKMRSREQKLIKDSAKRKKVIFTISLCFALAVIILMI